MNKLSLLALSTILFACESNKPDYILNKTAFCSGIGSEKQEEVICKDSNSNLVSGRIIEYFDDGKIHRNFVVKAGKPNGLWKRYENGTIQVESNYKNGKRNGYQKEYYENGKLRLKTYAEDDYQHGLATSYYENGVIQAEGNFKNGKRDGLAKVYSENGKLITEAHYKDGKRDGLAKEYYENGAIQAESNYKNGKRNGYQKKYYENGKLRLKTYAEDDYQHGLATSYYENGAIQAEGNFKNGKEDGYQKLYDKNGFLYQESQWKNGKKISETPKEKIKQANYEKCTKNIKLCSANHYDKDCLENLGGLWNNKITSITTEGVLVTFVFRDFLQSVTDRVFIYTKHEYLSGHSINKGYYYQYVGVYEYTSTLGTLERVKAFKETNIPVCDQFH